MKTKHTRNSRFGKVTLLGGALLALVGSPDAHAALIAFYDAEGDTTDASVNGNDGTEQGTSFGYSASVAAPISGRSSQSFDLDEANLNFVGGLPNFNTLAQSGGASISIWVQTAGGLDQDYIFAVGNSGNNTPFYGIQGDPVDQDSMRFFYRNDAATSNNATGSANVFGTGWNHLVMTHDGSNVNIYVNGSATADITLALPAGAITLDVTSLGVLDRSSDFGHVTGQIDEVAIYDTVLSASEISALAGGANPIPIPEPSSALLLGVAGVMGLTYRRRK